MKNSVAKIIYYSILVAVLLIALIVCLILNSFRDNRWVKSPSVGNLPTGATMSVGNLSGEDAAYRYPADGIQNLDIDWTSGVITIEFGDTQDLLLAETGSEPMTVKLDGNTLKLDYPQNGISLNHPSKNLHILVPRDWDCHSLSVDTSSASLEVKGGIIRETKFNTASGSSRFEDCAMDKLSIDSVTGNVVFQGAFYEFDLDGTSASVELDVQNIPDSINVDTVSGSLTLHLPSDCGFTVNHNSISGGYHSDFAATTHGNKQIHGNGSCEIDFQSVSASLTIRDRGENSHHDKNVYRAEASRAEKEHHN